MLSPCENTPAAPKPAITLWNTEGALHCAALETAYEAVKVELMGPNLMLAGVGGDRVSRGGGAGGDQGAKLTVDDLVAGLRGLNVGGDTGAGLATTTSALPGASGRGISGVGRVEPEHVGVVVIPQRT